MLGRVGVAVDGVSGLGLRAANSSTPEREARPIPRDLEDRLFQALGRLEENHRVDLAANDAYERRRATARDTSVACEGNSKPFVPPEMRIGTINLSDPVAGDVTKGMPPRQADKRRPP